MKLLLTLGFLVAFFPQSYAGICLSKPRTVPPAEMERYLDIDGNWGERISISWSQEHEGELARIARESARNLEETILKKIEIEKKNRNSTSRISIY